MKILLTSSLLLLFVGESLCVFEILKLVMSDRLRELKARARKMYGEPNKKPLKLWELELEDRLAYPRGDKSKLAEISRQWMKYYECCVTTLDRLTTDHTLPSVSVAVYSGAVANIKCQICVSPDEVNQVVWFYAQSIKNLTFLPIEEKRTAIKVKGTLTIYQVGVEHSGVYRCQIGRSSGSLTMLEVLDYQHNYTVVKPLRSHGPFPTQSIKSQGVVISTSWSSWSECSRCGRWGRRRRYGICHLAIMKSKIARSTSNNSKTERYNLTAFCPEGEKFLRAFPDGVWCRSEFLPSCIKNIESVRTRNNEIMLAMCRKPCQKDVIFSLLTVKGVVLERANNSAGIYSLAQTQPLEAPPPPTQLLYAVSGAPKIIRCPGTCLVDSPVSWRVGNSPISEMGLAKSSAGRVRINARDHIIFRQVFYSDDNTYSCWQGVSLCGQVKLQVWQGPASSGQRTVLILLVLLGFYTLRLVTRAYRARRI